MAAGHKPWFGENEDDEKALEAAREAVSSNEAFRRQALQLIKNNEVEILDTRQNLEVEVDRLAAYWATARAESAINLWKAKREKGVGKAGRRIQEFLTSFKGFLNVYSGIVEVIKVPGIPFGNVAYETLSLLLTCATNKTENESKITSALDKIKNRFPRMELLAGVYPTLRMKGFVSEVYRAVIEFARAAVFYFYTPATTRRIWVATPKPPELGGADIDGIVDKILDGLAEVNTESSTLLHKRAENIEQHTKDIKEQNNALKEGNKHLNEKMLQVQKQNEELKSEIERLKSEIHQIRSEAATVEAQSAQQRLEKFRGALNQHEGIRHEANIDHSAKLLEDAFATGKRKFKTAAEMYEQEGTFRFWNSCQHSCLLLFHGLTMNEGRAYPHTYSWLSPAAIRIAKTLRQETDHVAYYCCHPLPNFVGNIPVLDVLSNLICQILEWNPALLREHEYQWLQKIKTESFESTSTVFHELLMLAAAVKPVYIVLDRADQCSGRKYKLLHMLIDAVRTARAAGCVVKMLVVVDSAFWDVDLDECESLRKEAADCIKFVLGWDQTKG